MTTEEFIRDCARRGLSRNATRQALGLCKETFQAILEALGPGIVWPKKGTSLTEIQAARARRGEKNPKALEGLARGRENRRIAHLVTWNGVSDTVANHAKRSGVSESTARRRIREGWDMDLVFSTPTTNMRVPRNVQRQRNRTAV